MALDVQCAMHRDVYARNGQVHVLVDDSGLFRHLTSSSLELPPTAGWIAIPRGRVALSACPFGARGPWA